MRYSLVLLLALPLLGCVADQQRQLADCISDAEREYPEDTWVFDDARRYVWLCMAAYGYRLSVRQPACVSVSGGSDAVLYAQCYRPVALASSVLHKFETAFTLLPKDETRALGPRP
jgi:hypothetical protein